MLLALDSRDSVVVLDMEIVGGCAASSAILGLLLYHTSFRCGNSCVQCQGENGTEQVNRTVCQFTKRFDHDTDQPQEAAGNRDGSHGPSCSPFLAMAFMEGSRAGATPQPRAKPILGPEASRRRTFMHALGRYHNSGRVGLSNPRFGLELLYPLFTTGPNSWLARVTTIVSR